MSAGRWRRVAVLAALLAAFALGLVGGRLDAQGAPLPGSAQDPLVSESYVAQAISRAELSAPRGAVISLAAGATFSLALGDAAVVVSGSATGPSVPELVDLTAGQQLAPGVALPLDHLVLALAPQVLTAGPGGATLFTTAASPPGTAGPP